jgi:hypothetical protein
VGGVFAGTRHGVDAFLVIQSHPVAYAHGCPPNVEESDKTPMADDPRPGFTARQGQYLAFIHAYTLVNGRPPAEADMQRFFRVSGPAVHQMVMGLERDGLISRQPRVPRSIRLRLERARLPELRPADEQPVRGPR